MSELIATREFTPSLHSVMRAVSEDMRSESNRWLRIGWLVLTVGFAAWVLYYGFIAGHTDALTAVAAGFIAAGVFWFFIMWVLPRVVRMLPYNRAGFTRRRYKFDADALFLETADGVTLKAPYRTFARIAFRPDYVLFWETFPGFAMHAVPLEAFESKEQEWTLRQWLTAYARK